MKSNMLRKSGLGLLIVAGAMAPMASSVGEDSKFAHGAYGAKMDTYQTSTEGDLYRDLQQLQSAKEWTTTERGAQGPIRMESMDTPLTAGEGDLYHDLQNLQSAKGWTATERGAQGPIRRESMDTPLTASEGDLYHDLQKLQ